MFKFYLFEKQKERQITKHFTASLFYFITNILLLVVIYLPNEIISIPMEAYNCIVFDDDYKCIACNFPFYPENGVCKNNPSDLIAECSRAFTNNKDYYCFQCSDQYSFFSQLDFKCVECSIGNNCLINDPFIEDDVETSPCTVPNCLLCEASDSTNCVRCVSDDMIILNKQCQCPIGTYISENSCLSCKEKFGRFCKTCEEESCNECITPFCKYIESEKLCSCSFDIIRSCVFFNQFETNTYYDSECYCFNPKGECAISCKDAYHPLAFACDDSFGYFVLDDYFKQNNTNNCPDDQYFDIKLNKCVSCFDGCKVCNGNGNCLVDARDTRVLCPNKDGYVYSIINDICLNCHEYDGTKPIQRPITENPSRILQLPPKNQTDSQNSTNPKNNTSQPQINNGSSTSVSTNTSSNSQGKSIFLILKTYIN